MLKEHLIQTRAVEQAILDEVDGRGEGTLVDSLRVRIEVLDHLIENDLGVHPSAAFADAMERIRQHFDKDGKTPYKSWRGPCPPDQPSLPKDIRIVFEQLMREGVWQGDAPNLDPRWSPTA